MILNETAYKTKSNVGETSTFQIQSSAKAFKILSSNLYKDKITAVIRELSTNAVDAHIANGNKAKFKIHIPTYDNPNFIVKDNGIGMSEIEIHQLYTTYFGSNKSDSNEYTGALGLGSKSPFAYTDQFTVESAKDGVKNVFTCFLDESSMPTLSKVATMPSKRNGTKVTVPVNENDISTFREKAVKVFEYFDRIPKIDNQKVLDEIKKLRTKEVIVKGKGYKIVKTSHDYYSDKRLEVVMGNIKYPLSLDKTNAAGIPIVKAINSLYDRKLVIFAEIGELDISPSREELSYDRTTLSNIFQLVSKVDKMFQANLVRKVNSFKSEKERILYLDTNRSLFKLLKNPKLEIKIDREAYANDPTMLAYQLTERKSQSRGKHIILKSIPLGSLQVPTVYQATFISYPHEELSKRGRKDTILAYLKEKKIESKNVVIVDPESVSENMFIDHGCEYITKADLPDVVAGKKTYSYQSRLVPAAKFNCEELKDALHPKKKTYYLVSYRGDLKTLSPLLGGSPSLKDSAVTTLLNSLGFPVVIFKTLLYSQNAKRIEKSNKLFELTEKEIYSILDKNIIKKVEPFKEILATKYLFTDSRYTGELSSGYFPDSLNSRGKEIIRKVPGCLTDEQSIELMKVPAFAKLYKAIEYLYAIDKKSDEYSGILNYAEKSRLWHIVKTKIIPTFNKKELKDKYEEMSATISEVSKNLLLKGLMGSFGYYSGAKDCAEEIYESFVKF